MGRQSSRCRRHCRPLVSSHVGCRFNNRHCRPTRLDTTRQQSAVSVGSFGLYWLPQKFYTTVLRGRRLLYRSLGVEFIGDVTLTSTCSIVMTTTVTYCHICHVSRANRKRWRPSWVNFSDNLPFYPTYLTSVVYSRLRVITIQTALQRWVKICTFIVHFYSCYVRNFGNHCPTISTIMLNFSMKF